MKRIFYTILLLIACHSQAWCQKSYLQYIDIREKNIKKEQEKVEVTMEIDLSQMKIHRQHSVKLIPVIVAKDASQSRELPAIIINGKTRALVHQRVEKLVGQAYPCDTKTVITRHNGTKQTISYRSNIPREKWMSSGRLILQEKVSGCAECTTAGYKQNQETTLFSTCFPASAPKYILTFKHPAAETIKTREVQKEAKVQFRQNSRKIIPAYKNNQRELLTIKQSIVQVQNEKHTTIRGIYITGYASPEGPQSYNLQLSKARAEALARYLREELLIDGGIIQTDWKGEDWEGLRREVEKRPKLPHQKQVLAIIDHCTTPDTREKNFKQLDPKEETYKSLLTECYPSLRRNVYRIVYDVRKFNLEEAKQIIKNNPKLLSLHEMYLVAESSRNTPGAWEEIINIAARTFPGNGAAVANAAAIDMEKGDIQAAIRRLEKARTDPDSWGTLGVAYARKGNLQLAREYLAKAVESGDTQAEENRRKLEEYISELQ